MKDILVRDVPPGTHKKLRLLAVELDTTLEGVCRQILIERTQKVGFRDRR